MCVIAERERVVCVTPSNTFHSSPLVRHDVQDYMKIPLYFLICRRVLISTQINFILTTYTEFIGNSFLQIIDY